MALQNPSNLYSGGQGVFDSRPVLMFQANLMAKKQAKEDALNKLYQDLPTSINSAGMQTKDLHILDGIKDQIGEYWKNNKQSIINPKDSRAQTEYQGLINQAHRVIQVSKNGGDKLKIAAEVLKDPKKAARTPKVVLDKIALAQLPVNDPNYRELEEDDFVFNAEPYDETKVFKKYFGDIKMSDSETKVTIDPITKTRKVTTTSGLTDDDKGVIYNRAKTLYDTDPSVEEYVEKTLSNPIKFNELNTIFKEAYKKDINPNDPAELYAASMIGKFQTERTNMKVGTNPEAMAYLNDALIRGRMGYAASLGMSKMEKVGEGIKVVMEDEEANGNDVTFSLPGIGDVKLREITPLPGIKNRLSVKDQYGDVKQAERVFIDPKTKNRLVFDKKGLIGQYTPTQYAITIQAAELPTIPRVRVTKTTNDELKGNKPKSTETKTSTRVKVKW
jgi:hypothetical protein